MSLKRRDIIAWFLILLCVIAWTRGQQLIRAVDAKPSESTILPTVGYVIPTTQPEQEKAPAAESRTYGILLSVSAAVLALIAILPLRPTAPFLGPDCCALLAAAILRLRDSEIWWYYTAQALSFSAQEMIGSFLAVAMIREFAGWLIIGRPMNWCLTFRSGKRFRQPHYVLMIYMLWVLLCGLLASLILFRKTGVQVLPLFFAILGGCFGLRHLWDFVSQVQHFQNTLDRFQAGKTIFPAEGIFFQSEQQLIQIQEQNAQAIHDAVVSERFRIDLIANVSHDLRTPLTSILGYSELLEKENLSPEGRKQLERLHQKAGYMNDLVESLFELTKVSSGVLKCSLAEIDLIRLLEQTIGLLDDRLNAARLTLRRNYPSQSLPVITDGARMHQVFANLLGNAIKYAMPGTRIHLTLRQEADTVHIRIVNTASYEMDFQPEEILQRFARGDKARSTQGSGLGLAIAQTYTESVGGHFHILIDGDQFNAIVELPKTERKP